MSGVSELLGFSKNLFITAYVGWWLIVRFATIFRYIALRYYYI